MMDTTAIRPLRALGEMRAAVELQKTYWGDDVESLVPAHMLFSIANHGGHVLAAFDGENMVGVLIGFLGTSEENDQRPAMANLQIVSKRMVVLPEYRNQGLGYKLKLAQRDLAVKQGIRLVTWTFDPLLAANAHLNVRKLGVTSQHYLQDYYGTDEEGGLVTLGSSDRLLAEWWVTNRRVDERLHGTRRDLNLRQYLEADTLIINPTRLSADGVALPAESTSLPATSLALLEIPPDYAALVRANATLAQAWRNHTRDLFQRLLGGGYVITDFLRESYEGRERAFYLLSYQGPQFDSFTMN
jgi:predicted GNAT superfamily acetyltransferase